MDYIREEAEEFIKEFSDLIKEQDYKQFFTTLTDTYFNSDLVLAEVIKIFNEAGIDPSSHLPKEDWPIIKLFKGNQIYWDPEYITTIFGAKADPSKKTITFDIDYDVLADQLATNSRDFSASFLRSLMDYENFDYQVEYPSMRELKELIENITLYPDVAKKLQDLGITDDKQVVNLEALEENEDIISKLGSAYASAASIGTYGEAKSDFDAAFEKALPDYVVNPIEAPGGVPEYRIECDIQKLVELCASIEGDDWDYGVIDTYDTETLKRRLFEQIIGDISSEFYLREPQYGWNGFDETVFNDILRSEL